MQAGSILPRLHELRAIRPLVLWALVALVGPHACAAAPEPITMDEAVRRALAGSPRIRAARAEQEAAQVATDRERPVARPTLTAEARAMLQGPSPSVLRGAGSAAEVTPSPNSVVAMTVEQPLWRAGIGAAHTRYAASTRLNRQQFARACADLALEVRQACCGLLVAEAMQKVARDGVDLARAHLTLVRDMVAAGQSAERDAKAADADLAEAEQGALRAENGVALARDNVARLIGAGDAPVSIAKPEKLPSIPASPEAGAAQALVARPELAMLADGLQAARAGAALARGQLQPAIAARATVAHQTPTALTQRDTVAGGLVLTWNILDAGKARADTREALARASQLEAQLDEARAGIRLEVNRAWRSMREAAATIETASRQVESAEAAHRISELRYETRQATQMEVSGALLAVHRARANLAQAGCELHSAAAEYRHAIGEDAAASTGR